MIETMNKEDEPEICAEVSLGPSEIKALEGC